MSTSSAVKGRSGVRISKPIDGGLALVLNNDIGAIDDARLEIDRHLKPQSLSARAQNRLEVIFEELVSNIVRYGMRPGHDQSILVTVAAQAGVIRLTIEDDGLPFDPFSLAEPPAPRSLEEVRIGGLGIPLVRRLAASTAYERDPQSPLWAEMVGCDARPANRVIVTLSAGP
ncbi:MAG TPA: ATP-binding protein [Caulobacteraceae bacterium]|nr:ATP-binding protein [Caulobacteraceae bacterium]